MDYDSLRIRVSLADIIFDLMSNQVSLSHCFLSVDEKMEFDDTIESTLSHDTYIDMLDLSVA